MERACKVMTLAIYGLGLRAQLNLDDCFVTAWEILLLAHA